MPLIIKVSLIDMIFVILHNVILNISIAKYNIYKIFKLDQY